MFGLYYGQSNLGRIGSRWCGSLGADWWSRGLMIGIVLIGITIVVLLMIQFSRKSQESHGNEDAILLLRKRYARGEISHEEFETIRKHLS